MAALISALLFLQSVAAALLLQLFFNIYIIIFNICILDTKELDEHLN